MHYVPHRIVPRAGVLDLVIECERRCDLGEQYCKRNGSTMNIYEGRANREQSRGPLVVECLTDFILFYKEF